MLDREDMTTKNFHNKPLLLAFPTSIPAVDCRVFSRPYGRMDTPMCAKIKFCMSSNYLRSTIFNQYTVVYIGRTV